jgi:tetratricopeptide (TPR) repeat protein
MDDRAHAAEALLNLGRHLGFLGRLDEAHSRLKESITIYRDLGFGGSWRSLSFLARIDMLLGRYEQASSLAREALLLAQEGGYVVGIAYALWVLGRLAIAAGEYAEVQRILELNSSVSDEASLNLVLWFPGVLLGYAARGMSYPGRARQPLCEALRLYSRNGELGLLLLLLPAVALLLADRGEVERAVELYALVSRYPYVANAQWFEDAAGKHIAAAAVTLPPDVVVAAQERGRARDLMATAKELLAELEADLDKEDRLVGTEPSA